MKHIGDQTWFPNHRPIDWSCAAPGKAVLDFHRSLDGYVPTPLLNLPDLVDDLRVGRVLAKDESHRLGLPAFKALGASWAIHQALQGADQQGRLAPLLAATDGNHGRAVARFARVLGHSAHIWVPVGVHPSAIEAIKDEGAAVTLVEGSYDQAVAAAALAAMQLDGILIQDTAWEGYEQIPSWIVEGYSTMFVEIDEQLLAYGIDPPDLVIVPAGVGSLAQAAVIHHRGSAVGASAAVVSVEPASAACVLASLAAERLTSVETGQTIMAGLNCGTPSALAWPYLRNGLDAASSITEVAAEQAVSDLAALGISAGPCGAAGLAGARLALTGEGAAERRAHLGVDRTSTVVLLVTEGRAANPR